MKIFLPVLIAFVAINSRSNDKPQELAQKISQKNETRSHDTFDPKGQSCDALLKKLIIKSNLLEVGNFPDRRFWKKKLLKASFDTEFDDSNRLVIHVTVSEHARETVAMTISWLAIDSSKETLGVIDNDKSSEDKGIYYNPVECDKPMLSYIIHHCIDWSRR